jgi:DNA polymerase-1
MSNPLNPTNPQLLIVDGHAYAYRAFHAIQTLTGPDGRPTNAIFGFIKMVQKLQVRWQPTHLLVAWDGGLDRDRVSQLPEYKAQRPSTPEALEEQFPQIQEWLTLAGLAQVQEKATEADDWIATYTQRATSSGLGVLIASSDKDFLQLVTEAVGIIQPNDKSEKLWTMADVFSRTGVRPDQIVDWLALIGDTVDNIPGVPGVGPKTATGLLKQFDSIDSMMNRLSEVNSVVLQSKLKLAADSLRRNQQMIRLKTSLFNGPDLAALVPQTSQNEALARFYQDRGFRSLHAECLANLGKPNAEDVNGESTGVIGDKAQARAGLVQPNLL